MSKDEYTPTIGIECHVQLKTKTKLFAAVGNDAREAPPNTLISHICVGMPGALPVLNKAAIDLSVRAAFALNSQPQKFSRFERKHYFYPDLPKGYQITQYEDSLIKGGYVEITVEGKTKNIGVERANLEEDAGKNTHPAGTDYSLVDLNRAGTPLLEIVSQPEISSPAEAKAYARELWLIMKFADVTDGDMYHGHVRFDINVSVSKEAGKKGTRSETKNLNSFRSVENAVTYEISRQIELLEKGEKIVQETRGWDDDKQITTSQRSKEEAQDYRYMPEPDIPPLELETGYVSNIKKHMPQLPGEIRELLNKLSIDEKIIEDILDKPEFVPRVLEAVEKTSAENARRIIFDLLEEPMALEISLKDHIELSNMLLKQEISSTSAKKMLKELKNQPGARQLAEKLDLVQVSDSAAIEKIVAEVLSENESVANDIKAGEMKAIGFLVGQVMAKSKGQANPKLAQELIKKQLGVK